MGSTSEQNSLYKEGTGYPTLNALIVQSGRQYSLIRSQITPQSGGGSTPVVLARGSGLPVDSNDNAADFRVVDTNGTRLFNDPGYLGQRLGAPGPENLSSPVLYNGRLQSLRLDPSKSIDAAPNRVVDTVNPVVNGDAGTITFRRTVVNNTGGPITRLRLRIGNLSTYPAPIDNNSGTSSGDQADLRVLDADDEEVPTSTGTVAVTGLKLETPPNQPNGGGYNSSLTVSLAAPLAAGESVNVQWRFGIKQKGRYYYYINVEALP